MAYSQRVPTRLSPLAERTCFPQVPATDVRGVAISVVAGRAYTEMVPHVSAARALAAKVGDRSGESRDCAILGLGYWSLERRKEAAQHLERAAELASE